MTFLKFCSEHKTALIITAVAVSLLIIIVIVGVCTYKRHRFKAYFRKFHDKKTQGHPQYIYDEDGNRYKVIGITHAPKTDGVLNIKLEVNPEPENNTPAYLRPTTDEVNKNTRSKRLNGWKLSRRDRRKAKKVIRKSEKTKK